MDIEIEELVIEADRPAHIAKHSITIDEVFEIIRGDYLVIKGKLGRSLLVGQTSGKRLITIVVGIRRGVNKYGLVTARPTKKKERILYQDKFETGDEK